MGPELGHGAVSQGAWFRVVWRGRRTSLLAAAAALALPLVVGLAGATASRAATAHASRTLSLSET